MLYTYRLIAVLFPNLVGPTHISLFPICNIEMNVFCSQFYVAFKKDEEEGHSINYVYFMVTSFNCLSLFLRITPK